PRTPMTHRRLGPPPRAVALLSRRLGACAFRESILGDLDEEHAAITRRRSRAAADAFYWWQAIRLPRDRRNSSRLNFPGSKPGVSFMGDVSIAVRQTFKQPAHTLLIIAALGPGLGLNAAVYGMGDAVLVRPFPFPRAQRRAVVGDERPGSFGSLTEAASPANFLDGRAQSSGGGPIAEMGAFDWWSATLTGGDEPERIQACAVTPGFFAMLGINIADGREFLPGEDTPGRHRVVVLSRGLWERRFGSDRSIVGRTVQIDGHAYTVVGIG